VGIDLYTQMMEEAMAELRGEEAVKETNTLINLQASAFIPEDYISDMSLRLAAYKEISGAGSEDEIAAIAGDLRDRYGEMPGPVGNLLEIMKIKIIAKRANVARIDVGKDVVNITFVEGAAVAPDKVMALLKKNKGKIRLVPEHTLQIALSDNSLQNASAAVKKCLQELF
jgi:transcription-repair coupling factor (superfamily II helicase)